MLGDREAEFLLTEELKLDLGCSAFWDVGGTVGGSFTDAEQTEQQLANEPD